MNLHSVLCIFLTVSLKCSKQKDTDSTLNVHDRIALLKFKIAQEIKSNQFATKKMPPLNKHDDTSNYEYDNSNEPITPINENDARKEHEQFKLKKLKTTTEKLWHRKKTTKKMKPANSKPEIPTNVERSKNGASSSSEENKTIESSSSSEHDKKVSLKGIDFAFNSNVQRQGEEKMTLDYKIKPLRSKKTHVASETFYRRRAVNSQNLATCWNLCQDLISPYLAGHKRNMTKNHLITRDDPTVVRLLQLLSEDTTNHTRDEILSVLYQISNVPIKLFQWDFNSLKVLLSVINRGAIKVHTFRTVKQGLKRLLNSWHLDFTNTTTLLKQARIFRPPCLRGVDYEGSTKTSKSIRYSYKTKKTCGPEAEDSIGC